MAIHTIWKVLNSTVKPQEIAKYDAVDPRTAIDRAVADGTISTGVYLVSGHSRYEPCAVFTLVAEPVIVPPPTVLAGVH